MTFYFHEKQKCHFHKFFDPEVSFSHILSTDFRESLISGCSFIIQGLGTGQLICMEVFFRIDVGHAQYVFRNNREYLARVCNNRRRRVKLNRLPI